MKKFFVIALALLTLLLSGSFSDTSAQTMNEYCQLPSFVSQTVEPNILFVTDVSGSMGWYAYNYGGAAYNPATSYEGYFTPSRYYKPDTNGVYEETTPTGQPCNCVCVSWKCRRFDWGGCVWHGGGCSWWGCCTAEQCTGDCGLETGNYLNYLHMARVDLVRWAMTGGTPASCTGSQTFNNGYCDPELWNQPGNDIKVGTVCNNSLDVNGDGIADGGCILLTHDGEQVKVPWSRVNAGLAFKFKDLTLKPRMGTLFFSGTSVRSSKVYIGDFTAPNSTDDRFPYMNLITHINSASPSSTTPTGPAMWDALNYYAQRSPEYGGFTPQSGEGDRWRNPMYVCAQGGTNCQYVPCSNNFVILMSDGQWNTGGGPPATSTCSINTGFENHSADPVVPAYKMHMGFQNLKTQVNTKVTAVYAIGLFLGGTGEQSMKNVAMYGSFDNQAKTWPDNLTGYPDNTCSMDDCGSGKGSACEPLPTSSSDWDKDGNGNPDTFYKADNALGIKEVILNAILDILRRTASGTAVSILASGEGSGANLLQAFFYPKKTFEETEIDWVGEMQNLWYYLDPRLQSSTIREDTVTDKELNLQNDYIVHFRFDTGINKTVADRYNNGGAFQDTVELEKVKNLWEAGIRLWNRELSLSPRTLYTSINGTSFLNFSTANAETLRPYLQAADVAEATNIINYVHGIDRAGYRNRTVTITEVDSTPRVWKLGDIVSSTPRVQSWVKLNQYDTAYDDQTYLEFISSDSYKGRGMAYVGANDGMLHAFKLGKPEVINELHRLARLSGTNLGNEEWAFIPQNALPYLKYLADTNYCHLYYVDSSPYLFDASIAETTECSGNYWDCEKKKESWRTILIGGMGLGGACRNRGDTCADCVKTPMDGVGYSSYFALDVTDPQNPSILWEFSNPELGFSTSGPAIVRIGDRGRNGRWFAVFASGPTGPIDSSSFQFLGRSDQNLNLFILDLKTGTLVRTINTGISNAFGGFLINSTLDVDRRNPSSLGYYQDDVLYVGYTKKSGGNWVGGVLRMVTKEDINPNNWVNSTLIDNAGPITTTTAKLLDRTNRKLWIYFGTGRYFYKTVNEIDDADSQRALYGVKEPCYCNAENIAKGTVNQACILGEMDTSCTASLGSLDDRTSISPGLPLSEPVNGWYINLGNPPETGYKAERVITNPLAVFSGIVFFITFSPTSEPCGFGGNTYLWALRYNTGGAPTSLEGSALIQVSTGSIEEISLGAAFTERGGRRTSSLMGIPPKGQGLSVVINPRPIKRILHIQER